MSDDHRARHYDRIGVPTYPMSPDSERDRRSPAATYPEPLRASSGSLQTEAAVDRMRGADYPELIAAIGTRPSWLR